MFSYLKLFHLLFVFTWLGSLLALTRLMIFHVKQPTDVQLALGKVYRKMYFYVDLPSMLLALSLGALLLFAKGIEWKAGWLHMKLTFVLFLIICDSIAGWESVRLSRKVAHGRGWGYKVLHGVTLFCLFGVLVSIYLLKSRLGY